MSKSAPSLYRTTTEVSEFVVRWAPGSDWCSQVLGTVVALQAEPPGTAGSKVQAFSTGAISAPGGKNAFLREQKV